MDAPNYKPGYLTSEFYLTLLTNIGAIATIVFHQNLTGITAHIPEVAVAAAGLANAVYSYARSQHKSEVLKADASKAFNAGLAVLAPAPTSEVTTPATPVVAVTPPNPESFGS